MPRIPKYRRHKGSGQAVFQARGRVHYLGKFGTPESKKRYGVLLGEFLSGDDLAPDEPPPPPTDEILCKDVILQYWQRHVTTYYVKHGEPTTQQGNIQRVLKKYVRPDYGETPAGLFDSLALETVRDEMIIAGLARTTVNKYTNIIRKMFRWAAGKKLVAKDVFKDLETLESLEEGRSAAPETEPISPVADSVVEATLPELPTVVQAMVRFQRYTGARPSEVCLVRPKDVDRSVDPWCYRPYRHKMQHKKIERRVYVPKRAQEVLLPYLLRAADAYCFSPRESARAEADGMAKETQRERSKRPRPGRRGTHYTAHSYRRAIERARQRAELRAHEEDPLADADEVLVERWFPNQLRHSLATEVEAKFGPVAASVVLGHKNPKTTEIYVQRDFSLAEKVMRELG